MLHSRRKKRSAAANGDDDFDTVSFRQDGFRVAAARHDLAIAFDRDALARVAQELDQFRHRKTIREPAGFAVE